MPEGSTLRIDGCEPKAHGHAETLRVWLQAEQGQADPGTLGERMSGSQRVRCRTVWPICASKCDCVVNQTVGENSEVRVICLRKCRAVRNVSPESRISVSCWRWQEGGGAGVDEKPPEHPMTSGAPSTDSDLALVRIGQLRCPTCSCPLLRWNLVALTKYFTEQGELHGLLRARR